MNKELEDLNSGGASEEEVATLKKQKHELEMRLKEEVKFKLGPIVLFMAESNLNTVECQNPN